MNYQPLQTALKAASTYREMQSALKKARDEFHLDIPCKLNAKKEKLQASIAILIKICIKLCEIKAHPTPTHPTQTQGATPLQVIKGLAEEHDNYIPIFEYRAALKHLSRNEQDKWLYALERQDEIDLSKLVDPTPYTPKQIREGIEQGELGCPIFFIMLAAR